MTFTMQAAIRMYEHGEWFTTKTLAQTMGIDAQASSNRVTKMKASKTISIEEMGERPKAFRIVSIKGYVRQGMKASPLNVKPFLMAANVVLSAKSEERLSYMLKAEYPAWAIAERLGIKLSVARKLRTEYLERQQELKGDVA